MKRAEYEHTGFGRWKWVEKTYCDRCGCECLFPWATHHNVLGYEDVDTACYEAVRAGQPATNHFVKGLNYESTTWAPGEAARLNERGTQ